MRAGSQACSRDRSLTLAAQCWSWFSGRRTASSRQTAGRLTPASASAALEPLADKETA
jgi:hypothetical protein